MRDTLSDDAHVVVEGDDEFLGAAKQWNALIERTPFAIVYADTVDDISSALRISRAHGVCVVPRCSGHSWGGQSVLNHRVVLDISRLNHSSYDADANTCIADAGLRLGQAVDDLEPHGKAFTWGNHKGVCRAGFMQAGGQEFLQSKYGMALDSITYHSSQRNNGPHQRQCHPSPRPILGIERRWRAWREL